MSQKKDEGKFTKDPQCGRFIVLKFYLSPYMRIAAAESSTMPFLLL